MARKPTRKISYSFKVTEPGDVANPALSRTSGLTFWVAPPSAPPPPVSDTLTTDAAPYVPALDPLTDDSSGVLVTS